MSTTSERGNAVILYILLIGAAWGVAYFVINWIYDSKEGRKVHGKHYVEPSITVPKDHEPGGYQATF